MKTVALIKHGKPSDAFEIQEREMPQPKAGEVQIQCEGFGLNFADIMARQGLYRDAPPTPCVLGYEVVGQVTEAGEGVAKDWIGKRVVGFTRFGGYAEYACTSVTAIAEISDRATIPEATALGTQYVTAYFSMVEAINLRPGERVLVHSAAGGVGTALVQLAKWKGAIVIALVGSDAKIEIAKANGADEVINYRKEDYAEKLAGHPVDATFNAVGGKTIRQDLKSLKPAGRLVIYGAAERNGQQWGLLSTLRLLWQMGVVIPVFLMMKSQSVVGVNMLRIADHKPELLGHCMQQVAKLYGEGILKPKEGGLYHVSEIDQAHQLLQSGKSMGKVAVRW